MKCWAQFLTTVQRTKRLKRTHLILNMLKKRFNGKVFIFSDEKDFHVNKYMNRRNSYDIAGGLVSTDLLTKNIGRRKHPSKEMIMC